MTGGIELREGVSLRGGGRGRRAGEAARGSQGSGRSRTARLARLPDRRQDHQSLTSALGPLGWRGLGGCRRGGPELRMGKGRRGGLCLLYSWMWDFFPEIYFFPFTESDCVQINESVVLCLAALNNFPLIQKPSGS